jgi:hypothetical protein
MRDIGDSLAFSFESEVEPGPSLMAHPFLVTALSAVSEVMFPTVSETDY